MQNNLTIAGSQWQSFVMEESKKWASRYRGYVESGHPLMVVNYEELVDRKQIQSNLLRFSNFLHVPIKHSSLQCIVETSGSFPLKPKPLKAGFQPFSFLSADDLNFIQKLENETQTMIENVRKVFRPKVWCEQYALISWTLWCNSRISLCHSGTKYVHFHRPLCQCNSNIIYILFLIVIYQRSLTKFYHMPLLM